MIGDLDSITSDHIASEKRTLDMFFEQNIGMPKELRFGRVLNYFVGKGIKGKLATVPTFGGLSRNWTAELSRPPGCEVGTVTFFCDVTTTVDLVSL